MKKAMIILTVITGTVMSAFFACNTEPKKEGETTISKDSLISRGDYLVNTMGCDDCHTPKKMGTRGPEPDMEQRFAGFPVNSQLGKADSNVLKNGWILFNMDLTVAVGPWGTSYAANISSDATGIGNWTEQQFINCIRNGKNKGIDEGRALLPPMPWPNYSKLNDTDLKAIFAYLKTSKPVANLVPGPKPPGQ
jgi:hypothetical protein